MRTPTDPVSGWEVVDVHDDPEANARAEREAQGQPIIETETEGTT